MRGPNDARLVVRMLYAGSVREIHQHGFYNCANLSSLSYPPGFKTSLKYYGSESVFDACNLLPESDKRGWEVHVVPEDFADVTHPAAAAAAASMQLSISWGVTDFDGCRSALPPRAFHGRRDIVSIVLPESVTTIGQNAFGQCTNLERVKFPRHLATIENSAFHGCTALKSVSLPPYLEAIGSYAFFACGTLEEVCLPESVTHVGFAAFCLCFRAKRLVISHLYGRGLQPHTVSPLDPRYSTADGYAAPFYLAGAKPTEGVLDHEHADHEALKLSYVGIPFLPRICSRTLTGCTAHPPLRRGRRSNPPVTSRGGSLLLLLSADVRSTDDVIAF